METSSLDMPSLADKPHPKPPYFAGELSCHLPSSELQLYFGLLHQLIASIANTPECPG